MEQFKDIVELNSYINKHPHFIENVDVENLTVKYRDLDRPSMFRMVEEKYPAYILFDSKEAYEEFKSNSNIEIDFDFHSINTIRTNVTLKQFSTLREIYNIEFIELFNVNEQAEPTAVGDRTFVELDGIKYMGRPNWGAKYFGLTNLWKQGYRGKGVKIAVIDTAFRQTNLDYTPLKEYIIFKDGSNHRAADHGDKCISAAGTRLNYDYSIGTAPESELYALETNLETQYINEAYQWCIDNKIDIVSCSFTSQVLTTTRKRLYDAMYNSGVICVAAAGNDPQQTDNYPAKYETTIAISGVSEKDDWMELWGSSTNQPWCDFAFPSSYVFSTLYTNIHHTKTYLSSWNGTSAATPGFAGVLACLKCEFPDWSQTQLVDFLKQTAVEIENSYGVFPVYYKQYIGVETKIAKITKEGDLHIKGNLTTGSNSPLKFSKEGNLTVKNIEYNNDKVKFNNGSISVRNLIENSNI